MDWWDNDAKVDHINSAAARRSTIDRNPFIKLPTLPKRREVEDKVIVDLGCGYGRTLIPLAKLNPKTAYGLDISAEMLKYCAKYARQYGVKLKLINAALPILPFKKNSIDLVYSSSVLLHLPKKDIPVLLKEITRVLKPTGKFILEASFPNSFNLNGASNWFPSLLKSKISNKTVVPGMPKHYSFSELRTIFDKSTLSYKICPTSYQLLPTSINRFSLPFKETVNKVNLWFEKKFSKKGYRIVDTFFPRYFDVQGSRI